MNLIIIYLALLFSWSIIMFIRNNQVARNRKKILDKIYKLGIQDIKENRDWRKRFVLYQKITYSEQLYKFWRDLDSFWPEEMFI